MGIKKVYSNNYDNKKIVHFKNGKIKSVYAKKINTFSILSVVLLVLLIQNYYILCI